MSYFSKKIIYILNVYKRILTNKTKFKLLIIIAISLMSLANILNYFKNSYYAGAKTGVYSLGDVIIPSVESVVGNRDFELMFKDKYELRYIYDNAESSAEDIKNYMRYLIDEQGYKDVSSNGVNKVIKDNSENETLIIIELIMYSDDEYEIYAKRSIN